MVSRSKSLPCTLAPLLAVPCLALAQSAAPAQPIAAETVLDAVQVIGKRLDGARNAVDPGVGASAFAFDRKDIDNLPMGSATPLNEVLVRTPGMAQDSFGGIHLRGDHGNLQYRINGIILPDAISGFGQALDTRIASEINVLTGALPAQFGMRTAGVVDIRTRDGEFAREGNLGLMAGSRDRREAGMDTSGQNGPLAWFLSGSFNSSNIGIEAPSPQINPTHDRANLAKGFGYLSFSVDDDNRLSLLFGASNNRFQIPTRPGVSAAYSLAGSTPPSSTDIAARQRETGSFQSLAWQRSRGADELQIALFHRYSAVDYFPDLAGDLAYNGVASRVSRANETTGAQADGSWRLDRSHTLKAGLVASTVRYSTLSSALAFPADINGNQTSDLPLSIEDNHSATSQSAGVYVQDEWRATRSLTVNAGARLDWVSAAMSEHQLSPRLGLVYDLAPGTRLHAGYARYFTPPSTEKIDSTSVALYQGTTNALPGSGNAPLRAERSNYYDAGLSHQVNRELSIGLDAYYREVRHLQDEGQFGQALIFSGFNYARGRMFGTDLSATWRHDNVSAWLNAGYVVAKATQIETGQFNFGTSEAAWLANNWIYVDHDQRWSLSSGLAWQQGKTIWSTDAVFGTGLRRTPEGAPPNSDHLPAYTHVNASVRHPIEAAGIGPVEMRFTVLNVFDKVYELRDGTGVGVGAPQYGARRAFLVALNKRF
jgi:outer membrane receptor protein involved in Fe transport